MMSICEKTTTLILFDLQLVHNFTDGTGIGSSTTSVNVTTALYCTHSLSGTAVFEVEVKLWPIISRPVCLSVGLLSGAHDQICVFCLTIAGFLLWGTLFD
jgi:hypothetical protein